MISFYDTYIVPEKVGMGELMLENLFMGELWSWARFFFLSNSYDL